MQFCLFCPLVRTELLPKIALCRIPYEFMTQQKCWPMHSCLISTVACFKQRFFQPHRIKKHTNQSNFSRYICFSDSFMYFDAIMHPFPVGIWVAKTLEWKDFYWEKRHNDCFNLIASLSQKFIHRNKKTKPPHQEVKGEAFISWVMQCHRLADKIALNS